MKITILTLVIVQVFSICSDRTLNLCLDDESCQLTRNGCEIRPTECQQIDASNPNNCSGSKCYFNFILNICEEYEETSRILEDRRQHESSEHQQEENHTEQNNQTQENQNTNTNNGQTNTTPDTTTNTNTDNSTTDNNTPTTTTPDTTTTNSTSTNTTTTDTTTTDTTTTDTSSTSTTTSTDTSTTTTTTSTDTSSSSDSSSSDTIVFEMADLDSSIEELIQSRESERELKVVTSFSILLGTLIIIL